MHDPKYYILDEPTSGLDIISSKVILDTIKEEKDKGKCILYSTHYMEEAAMCGRIIVMDKGKVLMDDKPEEVFSRVEELKAVGLDVPQATELIYELNRYGLDLDTHIINEDECAEALIKLLS